MTRDSPNGRERCPPKTLWVNTTDVHLPRPFTDEDDLQRLWVEASGAEDDEQVDRQARDAILQGDRYFPKHLDLRIATGECEVKDDLLHPSSIKQKQASSTKSKICRLLLYKGRKIPQAHLSKQGS
jgi:hypothetical protein